MFEYDCNPPQQGLGHRVRGEAQPAAPAPHTARMRLFWPGGSIDYTHGRELFFSDLEEGSFLADINCIRAEITPSGS